MLTVVYRMFCENQGGCVSPTSVLPIPCIYITTYVYSVHVYRLAYVMYSFSYSFVSIYVCIINMLRIVHCPLPIRSTSFSTSPPNSHWAPAGPVETVNWNRQYALSNQYSIGMQCMLTPMATGYSYRLYIYVYIQYSCICIYIYI